MKWILTFICMISFVLLMTKRKIEMKTIFNDYQYVKQPWAKEIQVDRARKIMRPRLIPNVLDEETEPLTRTICLAHLLNRNQLRAWTEVIDNDIKIISTSIPAHVVHWKHLLVKYLRPTPISIEMPSPNGTNSKPPCGSAFSNTRVKRNTVKKLSNSSSHLPNNLCLVRIKRILLESTY